MDREQAIEFFKERIRIIDKNHYDVGDYREALVMGIQALQTGNEPQLVNYIADGYSDGELVYDGAECPNCGLHFEYDEWDWKYAKFCMRCGQALLWEPETMSEDSQK